jgi:hypothetical protein
MSFNLVLTWVCHVNSNAGANVPGSSSIRDAIVHWRLRESLASQPAFHDLWTQLTAACGACYAAAGHTRQTVLYSCQQAGAMLEAGNHEGAAAVYEEQCRLALGYGLLCQD